MVQHFSEFPKTEYNLARYTRIFGQFLICLQRFPEFSVEWLAFQKIRNFGIFWKFPYHLFPFRNFQNSCLNRKRPIDLPFCFHSIIPRVGRYPRALQTKQKRLPVSTSGQTSLCLPGRGWSGLEVAKWALHNFIFCHVTLSAWCCTAEKCELFMQKSFNLLLLDSWMSFYGFLLCSDRRNVT